MAVKGTLLHILHVYQVLLNNSSTQGRIQDIIMGRGGTFSSGRYNKWTTWQATKLLLS